VPALAEWSASFQGTAEAWFALVYALRGVHRRDGGFDSPFTRRVVKFKGGDLVLLVKADELQQLDGLEKQLDRLLQLAQVGGARYIAAGQRIIARLKKG
jgi:hypothetical protein